MLRLHRIFSTVAMHESTRVFHSKSVGMHDGALILTRPILLMED